MRQGSLFPEITREFQASQLINGQHTVPSSALAFEFQDYPDAPGDHGFPYHITKANTPWKRQIRYQFTIH